MESKGWSSIEIKKTEELPKNSWGLGYFHSSHEDWDGKTWIRNLHELRIRDLALFTLGDIKGKNVLDIGCGSGEYALVMAQMGAFVSGQDISREKVNEALRLMAENGIKSEIKVGDATKLLFDDNSFDAVFSADFFEHINSNQKNLVIAEAFRVLKPGGILTIKTPNLDYCRMSVFLKRICAVLRFKSPFCINIAHTHNNPDNEHHGLTTYAELERILSDNIFHSPAITYLPLVRKKIPIFLQKFLYGKKIFTEQIIITARKPIFYCL